jgi:hypothetical protein
MKQRVFGGRDIDKRFWRPFSGRKIWQNNVFYVFLVQWFWYGQCIFVLGKQVLQTEFFVFIFGFAQTFLLFQGFKVFAIFLFIDFPFFVPLVQILAFIIGVFVFLYICLV